MATAQTTRGYLGIEMTELTPQQLVAMKITKGVEVVKLDAAGSAAKAGLKAHDVIVTLDGQPVADRAQLQLFVRQNPEKLVKVGVIRGHDTITLLVKISAQRLSIEDEASEHAEAFGRVAFAACADPPDTYCFGPFHENRIVCSDVFRKTPFVPKTCELVVQIHATDPHPITFDGTTNLPREDRLAGYQWKGSIRFIGDKVRSRYKANGEWLPWDEWKPVHTPDERPSIMIGALFKRNGEWLAADLRVPGTKVLNQLTAPTDVSGVLKSAPNAGFNQMQQIESPLPIKQLLESIVQPSCEEIFTGKRPVQASPVQPLNNRTFFGTVDQFAQALPGFVEQASYAVRAEPKNYSHEIEFVESAARTCSQITPQMFRSITGRGKRLDFTTFGKQYQICNGREISVSEQVGHSLAPGERGIELQMSGVGSYGQDDGRGFNVIVTFSHLQGDSFSNVAFQNYGIVAANIRGEGAAQKPASSQ